MKNYTIGILGVASYATADLFKRVVDAFPAEKEWDRPRIIIDNYCTMPSRVRAILYHENEEIVINKITKGIENLIAYGADRVIVDCNTAHYYVRYAIENIPGSAEVVIDIIDNLGKVISRKYPGKISASLIASEGVIDTGIYKNSFEKYKINVNNPNRNDLKLIREMIEAVKQNKINEYYLESFCDYVNNIKDEYVIIGCTEIPVLYENAKKNGYTISRKLFDPLQCAINVLVDEYYKLPNVNGWN